MAFEQEASIWAATPTQGRKRKYILADDLLMACREYFAWAEANPLYSHRLVTEDKVVVERSFPLKRAMTVGGLCCFLGIVMDTWLQYRKAPEFKEVIAEVEETMRNQLFEGGAANQLNSMIISRTLGLAERSILTGPNGGPISVVSTTMTSQEAAEAYASTLNTSED